LDQLNAFWDTLKHSFRNLMPIVLVVAVFQILIMQSVPDELMSITVGLMIVVLGVALFLQGLDMGIFPIGKSLSNAFTKRGSLSLLMAFGFSLGFAAVIAEPALIAVASQAEIISEGRINALLLRFIVALSVGMVVALGIMRIIFGHPLHWYMIIGYLIVVAVTFFAPEEIVGLAYDSGGVTTNVVTVPLVAALGMGLAASIKGRNVLTDGFGLVGLAVMVPMITAQLYGIIVYSFGTADPALSAEAANAMVEIAKDEGGEVSRHVALTMLMDLLVMFRDVLPIIFTVLFFQYVIIRKPIAHLPKVIFGFLLVIFGLYAFVLGLKLGLFPIGSSMAAQLIELERVGFIYLFAFAIGFATTLAEPALIAIGQKAEEAAKGRLKANIIRLLVAVGVAIGITIGVHRIIAGDSIHYYIMAGYTLVILLTFLTPKYIVALAYDLGGVTTSEVTVPLVTALGIGLATHIEGRNVLIDGFGLIAFASIFPIVTIMLYAILADLVSRRQARKASHSEQET